MNNFGVFVKDDNGNYQDYTNYAVFPFNYAHLLDERLNEAYLTLVACSKNIFEPLTEIHIYLMQNVGEENPTAQSLYFVVANDNAFEQPVGSGKFKHQLYLIERTKVLEGYICDSIAFTNTSGNVYAVDDFGE